MGEELFAGKMRILTLFLVLLLDQTYSSLSVIIRTFKCICTAVIQSVAEMQVVCGASLWKMAPKVTTWQGTVSYGAGSCSRVLPQAWDHDAELGVCAEDFSPGRPGWGWGRLA